MVGQLFRQAPARDRIKSELVILLKPTIVDCRRAAGHGAARDRRSRIEKLDALRPRQRRSDDVPGRTSACANRRSGITPGHAASSSPRRSHQEALNTLLVALRSGEGFIKITGEVGTGKTLLCRKLLAALEPERCVTAYMPNPYLEPRTLLLAVADELGVPYPRRRPTSTSC
ncbi:MAG: AAA family ATPase [Chromatiales bacterium]|nr:AAA family ATPase [Chromatiales bacterium]